VEALAARLVELGGSGVEWVASRTEAEWVEHVCFFDVERERIWVFGGGCCTRHIIGRS